MKFVLIMLATWSAVTIYSNCFLSMHPKRGNLCETLIQQQEKYMK